MQRDSRKHFGGIWEATAGGSALQGEDALTCVNRELREETGIESEDLSEVGHVISDDNHSEERKEIQRLLIICSLYRR